MKSGAVLLCPSPGPEPFLCPALVGRCLGCQTLCSGNPYLIMAPKRNDAGNLNILLLCLTCKLNFIICRCVQKNKTKQNKSYVGFGSVNIFRQPLGSWKASPKDKRGLSFFSLVIRLEQVLKVELNLKLGVKVNFEKTLSACSKFKSG